MATAACSSSRIAATCRTPTRPASTIRSAACRCTRTPINDGVYDKHTVFVDNLVFPRFLLPFGPNALLTKESHAQEVWKYTDTNGDGVADKKELFDTGYGRYGNVEHEESFLIWGLDNWMYSTVNAFRARWTPHGVIKEPAGANGAQWGVTQDDDGKMWFQGGASGLPSVLAVSDSLRQLRRRPRQLARWIPISASRGARRCGSPTCRAA